MEQIIHLSEIDYMLAIRELRDELIEEMWEKYPRECEAVGLTDGLKKNKETAYA
jgi:hypothetical protein